MIGTIAVGLRQWTRLSVRVAIVAAATIVSAAAQPPSGGQVLVPGSSIEKPGDIGVRPHTNTLIFVPKANGTITRPQTGAGAPTPSQHHRKKAVGVINPH
jgi:hypothetical protein